MRISEPSFTDSGIDATGKTENQTCTRVDGRSAPSTLSLPVSPRVVSAFLGRGNQDGSVWKSLVYVTLYIRFPNLASERNARKPAFCGAATTKGRLRLTPSVRGRGKIRKS